MPLSLKINKNPRLVWIFSPKVPDESHLWMRVSGCWGPQKLDFINVAKQLDESRHLQLKRVISHYFALRNHLTFKFVFYSISHSVSSLYYFASKPNRHCVQMVCIRIISIYFHRNHLASKLVAREIYLLGVCDVKFSLLQYMAAKPKISKLQTSAQRQKSRPIEYHFFFI